MVARLLWEQDAAGSNPVTSTKLSRMQTAFQAQLFIYLFVYAVLLSHRLLH